MEKESSLNLKGKVSPNSVKTYNNNSQIGSGSYVSTQVYDGQSVKQGDALINYHVNNSKRQQLANKVDVKVTSIGKTGKGEIKKITELPNSYEDKLSESGAASAGASDSSEGEKSSAAQASNPVESDPSSGNDSE